MTINDLLKKDHIITHASASTQEEVFQLIAETAEKHGATKKPKKVVKGLKDREAQSTTGFQDGLAIPHTKSKAVLAPTVIIVKTNQGIEWASMDEQPASMFISLLIPEKEAGDTHLQLLSALSRVLMDETNREQLKQAKSPESIHDLLLNKLALQEEGN